METMKERIKRLLEEEKITVDMLDKYVVKGLISKEEQEWIENSPKNLSKEL